MQSDCVACTYCHRQHHSHLHLLLFASRIYSSGQLESRLCKGAKIDVCAGQGLNQGLEDAAELGRQVRAGGLSPATLRNYETTRIARVQQVMAAETVRYLPINQGAAVSVYRCCLTCVDLSASIKAQLAGRYCVT